MKNKRKRSSSDSESIIFAFLRKARKYKQELLFEHLLFFRLKKRSPNKVKDIKKSLMQQMLFYLKTKSPRFLYISEMLFKDIYDIPFEITTDKEYFAKAKCPKINYSSAKIVVEEFFIPPHSLLFENNIQEQIVDISEYQTLPIFFQRDTDISDFSFDIFAASFYLVSRYEEYLFFKKDDHLRFSAKQSLAFKNNFLHLPLVQLWMQIFLKSLKQKIHFTIPKSQIYQYLPTYDIDMAWAYKNKNFVRTFGGLLKNILKFNFAEASDRIKVIIGRKKDPFDTFAFFDKLHKEYSLEPIFFFLLGHFGKYDKNISSENPSFIELIQKIHQKHLCGIHPSYKSNSSFIQLKKEKEILENITKKNIIKSRQHFLKLSFPETYRNLIKIGIKEDYTLGYAQDIGFRASIGIPFFWYDLSENRVTDLKLFPFQVMDVTLKQYLKLSPKEALEKTTEIIEIMKKTGGVFVSLWHNSSFAKNDGWEEEWKEIYTEIVKKAK